MAHRKCCICKYMIMIEDEQHRLFHICTFSQSPAFLQEVGHCGECDIGDDTEEINGGFVEFQL